MRFNSYEFLFIFLPLTLIAYSVAMRMGRRAAVATLLAASLIFYASWDWRFVGLFAGSILANFAAARSLVSRRSQAVLVGAIAANLMLLGYYKYLGFFGDVMRDLGLASWEGSIILPLGISFLTFHQIAYLVDTWRRSVPSHQFLDYALYITFFPHLIAGPIVRPSDLLSRITRYQPGFDARQIAPGLAFLSIGLGKKVLIADNLASYVDPFFQWVAQGATPGFLDSWGAAFAYSFQLYFDFSGYSDMAVGLGLLVGLRLPLNFFSPYKAASLIEFWRRWHVTLSRFLRDYLYIPLGGSRHGRRRHFIALLVTFALCGLWHGAGYTFLVWGALHGMLLVGNHLWRARWRTEQPRGGAGRFFGWVLTFTTVTALWVIFRADSLDSALRILAAMGGAQGIAMPLTYQTSLSILGALGIHFDQIDYFYGVSQIVVLIVLTVAVTTLPNTYQWVLPTFARREGSNTGRPGKSGYGRWRPTAGWAWGLAGVAALSLIYLSRPTTFLYFQF